ncbi:hypothetical protein E4634_20920 [Mangrovimicrobium sediminis]|uniref:DUF4231 domain-containing protein n=1 Tax=Mangrovimicrobium sediminis TaxID=2562682 RepID=A0A4Z0LTP2_9GAMM|nr:hypothetical protein [Haliea sp. SAOS-164]TGD70642.1 hypothetical protein E4634_20920 [Haliea sp. SAOS-164]
MSNHIKRDKEMAIQKEILDYAWNWFEYHATQRLVAFRYFLIFLGILSIALNNALQASNINFAQILCAVGAFISIAFLMLEVRNEELVNVGRDALIEIEKDSSYPKVDCLKLLTKDRKRDVVKSHKTWLRLIYVLCAVGFVIISINPQSIT